MLAQKELDAATQLEQSAKFENELAALKAQIQRKPKNASEGVLLN
jgi:hypothetical protein